METQTLNFIGIEKERADSLSNELNILLANFQMFYQNLRALHWNIKGANFFELHAKFEELYTEANTQVDEIAERILTLGSVPLHTFEDYIKVSKLEIAADVYQDQKAVSLILDNLTVLLSMERKILSMANDAEDDGTADLLTGYISTQEKTAWMLNAWSF